MRHIQLQQMNRPVDFGPCYIALGHFDGLHRGHQALIKKLVTAAREAGLPSVLLSLHDPKRMVLSTEEEKACFLAESGLDVFLSLEENGELPSSGHAEWIAKELKPKLDIRALVCGEADAEDLQPCGLPLLPCPMVYGESGRIICRLDLLDRPFLAWHLSGGTTELLKEEPDGSSVQAEIVGGTSDISAGQLIDRTGVRLGLQFPAGKALSQVADESGESAPAPFPVKLNGLSFSLSGMENKVKKLLEEGEEPAKIARFTLETVIQVVLRTTREAQSRWPGLPVLCSGGVASNTRLRRAMEEGCAAVFAQPQYATDNAMGTAILTWRAMEREKQQ